MRHVIWTNNLDYDDWKEDLETEFPNEEGYSEDDRILIMEETNDSYLVDERANLDKELNNSIVVYERLGLWNGTHTGYKFLNGTNINDCLTGTVGDYVTWYVEDEELMCEDIHHDGTNYYTYRTLKPEYSQYDFEEYEYDHSTKEAIDKMTEPLGHYVAEIYGFNLENTYEKFGMPV